MPGQVRPVTDERDALLAYLAQQHDALRIAAYGLTDEQARATPTVGSLSVGGLIKHVAATETSWIDLIPTGRDPVPEVDRGPQEKREHDYLADFTLGPGETLDSALTALATALERVEATIATVPDLDAPVPVPKGVPWFPSDLDAWSVRWVLLHLIEEIARHAGHADIVRESIDGATAYPSMAAAEGWPTTPWMTPWQPAS